MSIMTGDHRFEEVLSDEGGMGGAVIKTMCDVLDRIEGKGIEKGEMRKAKEIALNLHAMGMEDSLIAKIFGVAVEVIKQWVICGSV